MFIRKNIKQSEVCLKVFSVMHEQTGCKTVSSIIDANLTGCYRVFHEGRKLDIASIYLHQIPTGPKLEKRLYLPTGQTSQIYPDKITCITSQQSCLKCKFHQVKISS